MKVFFWQTSTNFGDALNAWLWGKIFPELLGSEDHIRLVGVGSLLKLDLERVRGLKVIFGTGSGYGQLPDLSNPRSWKVYFVRGPLTASAACLPKDKALIDSSWLIGLLDEFKDIPSKSGVAFIPHYSNSVLSTWAPICERAGIDYIDPLSESISVIWKIAKSKLVLTESLHGAILADYFRTPWIPIRLSNGFLDFKWLDWSESVGIVPRVFALAPTDILDEIRQGTLRFRSRRPIESIQLKPDFPALAPTDEPRRVTKLYTTSQWAKSNAHRIRHSAWYWISRHRNPWPIEKINEFRLEECAIELNKLAKYEPYLSSDTIREEKLDRLSEQVRLLKSDYEKGYLFRSSL